MQRLIDDRDVVINTNTQHRHGRGLRHSWRFLLALGVLLLVVLACVTVGGAIQRAIDPVAAEQARWSAYQAQERAARLWWVGDGLSILPLAGGVLLLLALARHLIGETTIARWFDVQETRARHQPGQTPQQLTYSPHIAPHTAYAPPVASAPALLHTPEPEGAPLAIPALTDMAALAFRPTKEAILLGLGGGGMPLTAPVNRLCHVALCGATGGGKSNLLRLLMPQLQAIGAQLVLADPHYADLDAESGEDWRPIRQRLRMPPAVKAAAIDELLTWLTEELDQRLERRQAGQPVGAPLFFCYDELPVIVDQVPHVPARLGRLLREGRKVHLLTLGASQDYLVKTVGGSSAARDCYRTAFYVGGDRISAAALLDVPQRDIDDGQLSTGLAMLRSSATTPPQLVRIPYASNAAIAGLLGTSLGTSPGTSLGTSHRGPEDGGEVGSEVGGEVGQGEVLPAASDAENVRSERVRQLLAQKCSQNEILKAIWGASGGKAYQQALDEYRDILAALVQEGR